jgi:hypothetical protein
VAAVRGTRATSVRRVARRGATDVSSTASASAPRKRTSSTFFRPRPLMRTSEPGRADAPAAQAERQAKRLIRGAGMP